VRQGVVKTEAWLAAFALGVCAGLGGCATAVGRSPLPREWIEGASWVRMDVRAGYYDRHLIASLGDSGRNRVAARLSGPRPGSGWMPMMRVCAGGRMVDESSCVSFTSPHGSNTIRTHIQGPPDARGNDTEIQLPATFRVGEYVLLVVRIDGHDVEIAAGDQTLMKARTPFEIKTIVITCSSAVCDFVLPD
jgi:hypothetical protein